MTRHRPARTYHDDSTWPHLELGPRDDRRYFEQLIRAIFQAGLSWPVIESHWPAFSEVFHDFDPVQVAAMTEEDISRAAQDPRIIAAHHQRPALTSPDRDDEPVERIAFAAPVHQSGRTALPPGTCGHRPGATPHPGRPAGRECSSGLLRPAGAMPSLGRSVTCMKEPVNPVRAGIASRSSGWAAPAFVPNSPARTCSTANGCAGRIAARPGSLAARGSALPGRRRGQ